MEGKETVRITMEVTLPGGVKISASGTSPEEVAEALKSSIAAASSLVNVGSSVPLPEQQGERRVPQQLLQYLPEMSYKEEVLIITYYEGPMSRNQIHQRSRELGKEVSKEWLDTEFFRKPFKDYFVAETAPDGSKVYRLSELGKAEAERVISKYSTTQQ